MSRTTTSVSLLLSSYLATRYHYFKLVFLAFVTRSSLFIVIEFFIFPAQLYHTFALL
jgi:hypothetical protein